MNQLCFEAPGGRPPVVLFLGAHCDDIEIGCGATILRLRDSMPLAELRWIIFSSDDVRKREAMESARRFLGEDAAERVRVESFRDGYLPYSAAKVKDVFEEIKGAVQPDLIFTHYRHDLHQDHRLVCELTWNTWRNHTILEYEIPKYDGDLGQPNAFVQVSTDQMEFKLKTVLDVYATQASKDWFDADTLMALMRLRGVESGAGERFAEAYYVRKLNLGF